MKILYYSPNCGSGIEQIGFIYLLLLKSLGYNIDLINTQCCKLQKTIIKDLIFSNNYDYIILNEMHNLFFERIEYRKCNQKIFNICHSNVDIPNNIIALSLNYSYHLRIAKNYPIIIPLAYPFYYKNLNIKEFLERKYTLSYLGRYCSAKFDDKVKKFLDSNNIFLDYTITSTDNELLTNKNYKNLNTNEIYDLLLDTKYLLLPSNTECISLVVGEAQTCGCIPIVLETEFLEHEQFKLSYKCFNTDSFNETINKIINGEKIVNVNSSLIKNLSQEWHIERVKKQLETIFPKQDGKGSITLLGNNLIDKIDERCLHNAEIITNETLF